MMVSCAFSVETTEAVQFLNVQKHRCCGVRWSKRIERLTLAFVSTWKNQIFIEQWEQKAVGDVKRSFYGHMKSKNRKI